MVQLTRKRSILAKIETTYGTDPTPTGAANAILVRNLNVSPLVTTNVGRELVRPYIGEFEHLNANSHVECDFEVEIAGSGAAGTAPAYSPLLRACGMSETIVASTSVTYAPISTGFESVTIYFNSDGCLHKMTGCRGSVELSLAAKAIPVYKFKFTGIYNTVTDSALPTPTYTSFQTPLVCNNTNTTGFSFYGVSTLVLESLSLNVNNTVDYRQLIGSEYVQITDRKATGEVQFEATSIATLDIFTKSQSNLSGALAILHGTTAGNKVQITASKVDIANPSYADSNGVNMVKCSLYFVPTSGNDEFSIILT